MYYYCYLVDLHKCEEWKTIIPCDLQNEEWIESESEDDGDEEDEDDEDEEDDDESDQDNGSEDQEMENTC